jgi:acetolactate synthase-1/2/3 large subunit
MAKERRENGAERLVRAAIGLGTKVWFANPGTTELPLVQALDSIPGVRTVLGLFEGVCTGAADGYGRMANCPGVTLLHLGPGFANGIAYLHDARRARSPIVNLIGEHATWHQAADAPLQSDIESLARPVSAWVRRNQDAGRLEADFAEAVAVAAAKPGWIATLIVPHDHQLADGPMPSLASPQAHPAQRAPAVPDRRLDEVVQVLRGRDTGGKIALFLGGESLRERGLRAVARLAARVEVRLLAETFPARWERGVGTPMIERLPYFPEPARELLSQFSTIVLAGARSPVTFFGYPGIPSYLIDPAQRTLLLADPEEDVETALEALADALGAPPLGTLPLNGQDQPPPKPTGALTPERLCQAVAALLPDQAIVMDEGNTSSGALVPLSRSSARHTYLTQPGGAIGLGMPCAIGASLACPDRRVLTLQADGSAMYTFQALWTQAREQLPITTILCNNRSYRILGLELLRAGVDPTTAGANARSMIQLTEPAIDWVRLSEGLGVPAERVETAEALCQALERSIAAPGPSLIEAIL